MSRLFHTTIEVRGYELDSFNHVNHANYLNYLEYARWKMLEEMGVTHQTFQKWGRFPVIASVEIQYLKPALMGDLLTVETKLTEYRRSSMHLNQEIRRGTSPIAQAKIRSVIVDERGRPAPLPEELESRWKSLLDERESP